MLIRDYAAFRSMPGTHQVKMYYGVAALPSLHVAVLALFAIATRPWRGLSIALWVLTAVTFVGSLALGWHYAVDGYLGVALAWGCWWVARRIERPRGA
jgi:membrane-associated phospholipid phosphatase